MSRWDLLHAIWRGRFLILLSTAIGAGAAHGYLRSVSPLYQSTAVVFLQPQGATLPRPPLSDNFLWTQAAILTSQTIVSAAMDDPNIRSLVACKGDRHVADMRRTLSASVCPMDVLITISARSTAPEDAACFVNAVVWAFRRFCEWLPSRNTLLDDFHDGFCGRLRALKSNLEQMRAYEQEKMLLVWNAAEDSSVDFDWALAFIDAELTMASVHASGPQSYDASVPQSYEWYKRFAAACSRAVELAEQAAGRPLLIAMTGKEGPGSTGPSGQPSLYDEIASNCGMLAKTFRRIHELIPGFHPSTRDTTLKLHVLELAQPARDAYWPRPARVYAMGLASGFLSGVVYAVVRRRCIAI